MSGSANLPAEDVENAPCGGALFPFCRILLICSALVLLGAMLVWGRGGGVGIGRYPFGPQEAGKYWKLFEPWCGHAQVEAMWLHAGGGTCSFLIRPQEEGMAQRLVERFGAEDVGFFQQDYFDKRFNLHDPASKSYRSVRPARLVREEGEALGATPDFRRSVYLPDLVVESDGRILISFAWNRDFMKQADAPAFPPVAPESLNSPVWEAELLARCGTETYCEHPERYWFTVLVIMLAVLLLHAQLFRRRGLPQCPTDWLLWYLLPWVCSLPLMPLAMEESFTFLCWATWHVAYAVLWIFAPLLSTIIYLAARTRQPRA